MNAAASVFAARGYSAATLQEIAQILDFTPAALYYYVKSKADLLVEICLRAGSQFALAMNEVLAQDAVPEAVLRDVIRRHLQLIHGDSHVFSVTLQERSHLPRKDLRRLDGAERRYYEALRDFLADGVEQGAFRIDDPSMAASTLIGMMNWTLRWYRAGKDRSLEDVADHMFEIFYHGVEPGPS